MDKSSKIAQLIKDIAGEQKTLIHAMQVVKVQGDVCSAKLGSFVLTDIKLSVLEKGAEKGLLITPKQDSTILVLDKSGGELRDLVAVSFTEIESISINVQGTKVLINKDEILLNEGKKGELVNIKDLKQNLDKLKDYIDNLQTLVSTAIKACVPAGAGAAATLDASWTPLKSSFLFTEMKDDKVKH